MDRVPMTPEGHAALQAELKHHLEVLRPKIVKDIEEARAHGDISENSEYEDAKERQAFLEGRMRELESQLAAAQVIDPSKLRSDRVIFGATVSMEDTETGEAMTYQIVGVHEADVASGRISCTSPIARALIGRSEGDVVKVRVPKGEREIEITGIRFV